MVTNPLANIFRQSPFKALQEHMRAVIQCVDELPGLFEALAKEDWEATRKISKKVSDFESEADLVKNQLREHLPKGLFMAVDRRDLLTILTQQDSIADVAEDIADLVFERQMKIPEPMKDKLLDFVSSCIQVVHSCSLVIEELDELLEMGFRGKEAYKVEKMVENINIEEERTDQQLKELSRILFKLEDEMKPVSVIFWYKILEWIGDLADQAEKTGNRLRLIIAR